MRALKLTIGIPMLLLAFSLATTEPTATPWTLKELLLGAGLAAIAHFIRWLYQHTKYYKQY